MRFWSLNEQLTLARQVQLAYSLVEMFDSRSRRGQEADHSAPY